VKILHAIANLDYSTGGLPRSCLGMARAVARRGHEVTIITTDRNIADTLREDGNGHRTGCGVVIEAYPGSFPRRWETSWALRRRAQELVPQTDVVHIHSLYFFHAMVIGGLCQRFGVPYLVRPHGTLVSHVYRHHRPRKLLMELIFQNRGLRKAAGLHFATEEEWRLAQPYALNARGCIIPNGIDIDSFNDLPPRALLQQHYPAIGERKVLLFLGRLHVNKGLNIAIDAFAQLASERDDVHLVLAGPDGGMRAAAEAWARKAGIDDRVTFTGLVTGEDRAMVLAGSDVFVLPSLGESFGMSVIEAAACGLPLVISDRVNLCTEFVTANACLVAPLSAKAFAAQLSAVLQDPGAARMMADRALNLVRCNFTWDGVGRRLEEAYQQVIRDRKLPLLA